MEINHPNPKKRCAGVVAAFTLIELMIVVVLIGILSAMIIPEMKGTFEDALLRSTSRKLMDVFILANSQAVAHSQVHAVRLDTRMGKYQLEKRVRHGVSEEFVPVTDLAGSQGELDLRISIKLHETIPEPVEGDTDAGAGNGGQEAPATQPDATEVHEYNLILFNADGTADARDILLRDRTGYALVLRLNPITAGVRILEAPPK